MAHDSSVDDFRAKLAAALVSFALLSCGGGGGGSPPAPQISKR